MGALATLKSEAWSRTLTAIRRESTWDSWQVPPELKGKAFGLRLFDALPASLQSAVPSRFQQEPSTTLKATASHLWHMLGPRRRLRLDERTGVALPVHGLSNLPTDSWW